MKSQALLYQFLFSLYPVLSIKKEDLLVNLKGNLIKMEDEFSDAYSETFPAAGANAELNPGHDKDFKEVSLSSENNASRDIKGGAEPPQKKKGRQNSMQTLKKAVLISTVAVAVAGVVIAITKKLKEK
ncbi:uncharacterized protein LOC120180838 [Hibiscus syriacus]|uniref:uncharacterized protein LOC120180838 n=1 Tax=Hibiscus syriacus TaxID=106335 RepID=UPI0019219170|nr:uncharacterized protein LOC120180838 [Hibiscus syriacus]